MTTLLTTILKACEGLIAALKCWLHVENQGELRSKATVHRSVKKGDFPIRHFVINGAIRFLRRDVQEFLYGELPSAENG